MCFTILLAQMWHSNTHHSLVLIPNHIRKLYIMSMLIHTCLLGVIT